MFKPFLQPWLSRRRTAIHVLRFVNGRGTGPRVSAGMGPTMNPVVKAQRERGLSARRCTAVVGSVGLIAGASLSHAASLGAPASMAHPFQNAIDYTVEIRTTVQQGFNDEKRGTSLGAGFLIDRKRGWIMTNAHVVGRSPSVSTVSFHDQGSVPARKIYVDPHLDMAVIAVDPASIPKEAKTATLRCDAFPDVGDPVGAMGHPGGFTFTATRGIVSGVSRRFSTELLQIDAPINPGNSGGPLLDLNDGRVVGINTAMLKGAQNTNFAVPSLFLCPVVSLLEAGQDPSPPRLPWEDFKDDESTKPLKVAKVYEPLLTHLLAGDRILAINGQPAPDHETPLLSMLRGAHWPVTFTVERHGQRVDLSETLPRATLASYQNGFSVDGALFGMIDPPLPDEIKASNVGVHAVESGSVAENQDVDKSDFVIAADDQPIEDLNGLRSVVAAARAAHRPVRLTLQRFSQQGGTGLFLYFEKTLPVIDVREVTPDLNPAYLSPSWSDRIDPRHATTSVPATINGVSAQTLSTKDTPDTDRPAVELPGPTPVSPETNAPTAP